MTAAAARRLLFVCFSASGAAALVYQVVWVRLFTLALGHTVAAASTVLAAFMGGRALAAGAALPAAVAATVQSAGAEDWTARGAAALGAEAFGMAHESFRRALALDSRSVAPIAARHG